MVDAGSIWVKLGLDSSGLKSGLADAKTGLVEWRDQTNANTKEMGKWGAAIGATVAPLLAVSAASYELTQRYGAMANGLLDLSRQTDISVEKLQQIEYACKLSGGSVSTAAGALNKLTLSMAAAADPASSAAKAFREIGVDITGKPTSQVFDETALALSKMDDVARRNALGVEIYGKNFKELLPIIDTYTEKTDEISKHPVYSEKELNDLNNAKIAWDKLTDSYTFYSGTVVASIIDVQTRVNKLNPVALFLLGGGSPTGSGITGGSDLGSPQISSSVSANLVDRFEGLTDAEIELITTQDKLTAAQEEYNEALVGGDQDALDAAALKLQTLKNKYAELTAVMGTVATVASSSSASVRSAWADTVMVGSAGSEMQIFMQAEMDAGIDYNTALNDWASGTPTGGPQAGTLGAVTPGSSAETKLLTTELDKQAGAWGTLHGAIKNTWTEIERDGQTHYTTLSEYGRTFMQKLMDDWHTSAKYITETVAYAQTISVRDGVPAATAQVFTGQAPPTLETIDLSGTGGAGKHDTSAAGVGGTSGTGAEVKVTVVVPKETPSGVHSTTQTNSRNEAADYSARVV